MSSKQRAILLGLAALTVVVAVIVASSGGGGDEPEIIDTRTESTAATSTPAGDPTATTEAPEPKPKPEPDTTVVVRGGKPEEGVEKFRYRKGSTIAFTVRSDVADEIHLHGYDVSKPIAAGGTVRFAVPATVEGRFEAEMEQSGVPIARIEVVP